MIMTLTTHSENGDIALTFCKQMTSEIMVRITDEIGFVQ